MKAKITLGDGFCTVSPFPEQLLSKLRYWKRSLVVNEKSRKREFKSTNELLYRIEAGVDSDGNPVATCVTLPGFAKRCKDFLTHCGWQAEVVDARTPMPPPDMAKAFQGLREYQLELTYNLLMSGGGILSAATGGGKTRIICAICRAYPHEALMRRGTPTIVVAVPDKDITRKNWEEMSEVLPDRDVGIIMSGTRKPSDDIQVITLDSLQHLDPDDVGILIVDEMHTAASDTRASELLRFTKARVFGVSATPDGRFDGKDTVAEGIFGPVVATFSYQDGVKAGALVPIKVYWIDAPEPQMGAERCNRYKTRDQRYKWGVYHNMYLNRMIGRILKGFPPDQQVLGMLQFTGHMEQVFRGCAAEGLSPMPLQAHAGTDSEAFRPPEFEHVHAISSKARKDIYPLVASGEAKQIISTHIYKQGVNFVNLRAVINIGGGGSEIVSKQVPGRASRKVDGKDSACIIEFFHPWDVQKSKRGLEIPGPIQKDDLARRKIYSELGFEQINLTNERGLPWMGNNSTPTP